MNKHYINICIYNDENNNLQRVVFETDYIDSANTQRKQFVDLKNAISATTYECKQIAHSKPQ